MVGGGGGWNMVRGIRVLDVDMCLSECLVALTLSGWHEFPWQVLSLARQCTYLSHGAGKKEPFLDTRRLLKPSFTTRAIKLGEIT